MKYIKHFSEGISRHIDFHFSLALIAILGTTGSLYLQLNKANTEFDTLNASIYSYSVVRSQERDLMENEFLSSELDELEKSLDVLILD